MAEITGDDKSNVLTGTSGSDLIWGQGGNDFLRGLSGDDILHGGAGTDFLFGGKGDDRIFGEAGTDVLVGGAGDDELVGGGGTDYLWGGPGLDRLSGGDGRDFLLADSPGDTIHGDKETDTVIVTALDTTISANDPRPQSAYFGDEGFDTLKVISNARWEGPDFDSSLPWLTDQPSFVRVWLSDRTFIPDKPDTMTIGSWSFGTSQLKSTIDGFERIEVGGDVQFQYVNERDADMQVVGTKQDDSFWTGGGDEIVNGGAGDDDFHIRLGGNDTVLTGTGRDELFVNEFLAGGSLTIQDFTPGEDKVHLQAPEGQVEQTAEGTRLYWGGPTVEEAQGSVLFVGVQATADSDYFFNGFV